MGNVQSVVPYQSQVNKINVPLACNVAGEDQPAGIANLTFSVTAPLYAGSAQEIYFSDVAGSFNIAPIPVDGRNTFPKWSLYLNINTSVSNATPGQSARILQTIGQDSSNGNFVFPGPNANGPLPALGPFTVGSVGSVSELTLGQIDARLDFITPANSIRAQQYWHCAPAQPPYVISSVPVTTQNGPSKPSTGSPGNLPDIAVGKKYTSASSTFACLNAGNFNWSVSATTPASVKSGEQFRITDLSTFLTIPGQLAAAIDGFYGSAPPYGPKYRIGTGYGIDGFGRETGPGLNATIANGSPGVINLVKGFSTTYSQAREPLVSARVVDAGDANDQVFPLPQIGTIDNGNFTAGAAGSVFSISLFQTYFGFAGVANNDAFCGQVSYSCNLANDIRLFSIPIY